MSVVSLAVPFVVAYIWYVWAALSRRPVTEKEAVAGE
jgi:cytochrome d ubiquinol oxidase subunit II